MTIMSAKTADVLDTLETPFLDAEFVFEREDDEAETAAKTRGAPQVLVVGLNDMPLADGEYAFHQDGVIEKGSLASNGLAAFTKINPARPFLFEVRDRVCAIRAGAFFNPDDPRLEYGGT